MKKKISFLFIAGIACLQLAVARPVLATDNQVSTAPIETIEGATMSESEALSNRVDNMLPSVSIEEATNLVEGKMNDVVYLLQKVAKPLAQIALVASMITMLFGVFGDSSLITRGLLAIVISGLVLFLVSFAPEILDFITGWMAEGTEQVLGNSSPF